MIHQVNTATYRVGALWSNRKRRNSCYPTGPVFPLHTRPRGSARIEPLRVVSTQTYTFAAPRVSQELVAPHKPIFILSPLPRSGTNYIFEMLCSHRDCVPGRLPEDMMLRNAELLEQYAQKLHGHMLKGWQIEASQIDEILAELGSALLRYLSRGVLTQSSQRLITKTPWMQNIHLFRRIFPDAFALLLVRDGRSTIASCQRASPHLEFATLVDSWTKAASAVVEFFKANPSDQKSRLVRYEDVMRDVHGEVENLLGFLGLPDTRFDWHRAQDLPIFGSSFSDFVRANATQLDDNPNILRHTTLSPNFNYVVEKRAPDFNPIERWHDWTAEQLKIFADVAGEVHLALGYSL